MSKLQTIKHEIFRATIFFGTGIALMGITYAAISWPASAPSGETAGGKYVSKLVPTGAIQAFNLASCPTGWIAANGSNGTPDLRGEFIRGLDSGRGVDTSRTLASSQAASTVLGSTASPTPAYLVGNNWALAVNSGTVTSDI